MAKRIKEQLTATCLILLLFLFALCLRLLFSTGVVFEQSHVITRSAWELSNYLPTNVSDLGDAQTLEQLISTFSALRAEFGIRSLLFFLPTSVAYSLFGITDATSLLFPISCSLIGLLLMYGIVRLLADEKAGLLAAFFWAILPIEILYASTAFPTT